MWAMRAAAARMVAMETSWSGMVQLSSTHTQMRDSGHPADEIQPLWEDVLV
jgi:hypothetical protein